MYIVYDSDVIFYEVSRCELGIHVAAFSIILLYSKLRSSCVNSKMNDHLLCPINFPIEPILPIKTVTSSLMDQSFLVQISKLIQFLFLELPSLLLVDPTFLVPQIFDIVHVKAPLLALVGSRCLKYLF